MLIPGFLITWLTFPGVIVHEFAHKLFCHLTGTKVIQVCYFRFGKPAGFVIHEHPSTVWKHILVGVGPFFVNTVIGLLIGLSALFLKHLMGKESVAFIVLIWLAVSIAMHSFPSTGDARNIWAVVWKKDAPVLAKVVGTPLVGIIFAGAVGSIFWLDLIYGLGIVVGIPSFLHLI